MYQEKIVNALTGEVTWRDYTVEEIKEVEAAQKKAAELEKVELEKQIARKVILDKLGLTTDEAKVLLS